MNFAGIVLAIFMLFAIGFGFFWVIKLEYHLGAGIWKAVLTIGLLICLASLLIQNFWGSALLGIFGGSVVWGATEFPEQEKRVQRGLFPANPKRQPQDHVQ